MANRVDRRRDRTAERDDGERARASRYWRLVLAPFMMYAFETEEQSDCTRDSLGNGAEIVRRQGAAVRKDQGE